MSTTDRKSPDFYLDWTCRVTEEACAHSNLELSEAGREVLREIWQDVAEPLAQHPAYFRAGNASMKYWLSEAAHFMLKAAEYCGADSIGPKQVLSGTRALMEARAMSQVADCTWCDPSEPPPPSRSPSAAAEARLSPGPKLDIQVG